MKHRILIGFVLVWLLLMLAVSGAWATTVLPIVRNNCAHPIIGDVNGDGDVSLPDLSIIASAFGSRLGEPRYQIRADMNCDRRVDWWDLRIYELGDALWDAQK